MNRRQLTFQTCTQGWCWCTPPRSERTARPAALQPPGGGGVQAPIPPPPRQLIGSNTCASGAPGALSPEGAAERGLVGDDLGCLSPPQKHIFPSGHANEGPRRARAEEGGGGAQMGHPDCDLGLKDFQNGLGAGKAGGMASSQA